MWKSERRGSLKSRLILALAVLAVIGALGVFMSLTHEQPDGPRFLAGGRLTTNEHHRHLLAALAAGELSPVPNSDTTPRFPYGPDWADVTEGEDMVLILDSSFDIEGATDAAQTSSLRLFIPGEIYRDSMTLEFRNGQTADGALLFVTNTSHAWNWTIIGYPIEGTARLNRTGKSNIDAEFDVEYRCIGYVYRGGEGETVHEGWEAKPAKQCPQSLFPPKISFGLGVDVGRSDWPEKLPYTGGAS